VVGWRGGLCGGLVVRIRGLKRFLELSMEGSCREELSLRGRGGEILEG